MHAQNRGPLQPCYKSGPFGPSLSHPVQEFQLVIVVPSSSVNAEPGNENTRLVHAEAHGIWRAVARAPTPPLADSGVAGWGGEQRASGGLTLTLGSITKLLCVRATRSQLTFGKNVVVNSHFLKNL